VQRVTLYCRGISAFRGSWRSSLLALTQKGCAPQPAIYERAQRCGSRIAAAESLEVLPFTPPHHLRTSSAIARNVELRLSPLRSDQPRLFRPHPAARLSIRSSRSTGPLSLSPRLTCLKQGAAIRVLSHGRSSLSPVGQTRSKRGPHKSGLFPECGPLQLPGPAPRSVKSPLCWRPSASSRPPLVRHPRAPKSSSHSRQASASSHPTMAMQNRATPAGCL